MSLNQARIVYYTVVVALVLLFISVGSLLDLIAAGLVSVGSPFFFHCVCQAARVDGVRRFIRWRRSADEGSAENEGDHATVTGTHDPYSVP